MKINLLKKLLCLSPVIISPILVTACGNSDNGGDGGDKIDALKLKTATLIQDPSKVVAPGKFYLDFYQRELNAVWATKTAAINAAATNVAANHQYDMQLQVLSEVLTKVKTDGAAEFKKEFPTLDDYNADIFDDITVSFTIPDDSKGNLKIADDGVLSVYPTSIVSGAASEKQINYTLKLTSSKVSAKDLSGSLKFDLNTGFINYSNTWGDDLITDVYGGGNNMSTILVGSFESGLDVGAKQADGSYDFKNYKTGQGLIANDINKVYSSADASKILVGTYAGLSVGTRAKASDPYTFKNYNTSSSGAEKLANNNVYALYGNADLSTILVGEGGGGIDVGTKQGDGSYNFTNYDNSGAAGKKLNNNDVQAVYGSADLSTILVGEYFGGMDVGTKQGDGSYNFKNYKAELSGDNITNVFGSSNLSTILVAATGQGLDVGTRASASDSYTFTNYKKPDLSNNIFSLSGNADLSTILVSGNSELYVGTRAAASDNYGFTKYNTSNGLAGGVRNVYGSSDLSTILVGTSRGLDISSNLWFA